jgi:hypothetical protein
MEDIAYEIRNIVDKALSALIQMQSEATASKNHPDRWSQKEILGHLIDSAANNHQRFVRASYNAAAEFPLYNQNEWVRIQRYNESQWPELVELWAAYNRHLSNIIERILKEALDAPCNIGKDSPVTLEFVAKDYVRHLRHHLDQLLNLKY